MGSEHTAKAFDSDLQELTRLVAEMGGLAERMITDSVDALILDRLLHHATVLQIDGDSYRMRSHRARLTTLRAGLNHPAEGGEFSRSQLGNSHDR